MIGPLPGLLGAVSVYFKLKSKEFRKTKIKRKFILFWFKLFLIFMKTTMKAIRNISPPIIPPTNAPTNKDTSFLN